MKDNVVSVRKLDFSYNGKRVLNGITLDVQDGEFLGILGPNGSGKTTLLKCLNRSLKVPRGRVNVLGRDVLDIPRKELARIFAVVSQEASFGFDFTVDEVVSMGRYPHLGRFEFESPRHRKVVEDAMRFTEVIKLREKQITRISGGEKQRVMIAQALAQEPRMLLLDEPIKNLDIGHALDVLDLMKRKNREEGVTVVAVLHDLNLAARYCGRAVLLMDGGVFAAGPVQKVLTPINITRVFGVRAEVDRGAAGHSIRVVGRA